MSPRTKLRCLLLQARADGDPIAPQEIACFASALGCDRERITPHSLLGGAPSKAALDRHDLILIGGSGDYSAAAPLDQPENEWLARTFDLLRRLHAASKPTFGSCWGFQALCRALGGDCRHDPDHAELGPTTVRLTEQGQTDPVFGQLKNQWQVHAGHEDRVTRLPPDAVLLASSRLVAEQAVRFSDKPIYATQFHPELTRQDFLTRVAAYPKYLREITGLSYESFATRCVETPDSNRLLRLMVASLF